jgi:hypothetical protein
MIIISKQKIIDIIKYCATIVLRNTRKVETMVAKKKIAKKKPASKKKK